MRCHIPTSQDESFYRSGSFNLAEPDTQGQKRVPNTDGYSGSTPGQPRFPRSAPTHTALNTFLVLLVLLAFLTAQINTQRYQSRLEARIDVLSAELALAKANISLDEISISRCKTIAEKVVLDWSKDMLARKDFALAHSGALVVPNLTGHTTPTASESPASPPRNDTALQHDILHTPHAQSPWEVLSADLSPDSCWRFEGTQGYVGVALPTPIVISNLTIDHIPRELTLDMGSAPRSMILWGLVEGDNNMARHSKLPSPRSNKVAPQAAILAARAKRANTFFLELASFEYDVTQHWSYVQTFPVHKDVVQLRMDFGIVLLEVQSNWGANFTCIYRMRIHND